MSGSRRHAPWLFLLATLAWTWAFWIAAAFFRASEVGGVQEGLDGLTLLFFALGGFGPAIMASAFVLGGRADETLPAFWRRALDPRRLRPNGWLAALLLAILPPAVVWLGAWGVGREVAVGSAGFFLVGALAGLAEEPGWRGYLQEGLQRRMPVAAAALVVGAFWAAWHLPLFWIAGTWQHGQGVGTPAFWTFHVGVVILGLIYAWLYNFAGRVTLAAIVLHAAGNVASEVFTVDGAEHIEIGVYAAVAALLVAAGWGWMRRPATR